MRRTARFDELVLPPGGYCVAGDGCRMRTMLGSGVVVTLWERTRKIGAMAHFLPSLRCAGIPLELDGHCGLDGLQRVLDELDCSHINPADCVARICGGGLVVSRTDHVPSLNSGQANGEFARRLLRACALPIISEGFYPMGRHQIMFDAGTGRVQARRIKPVIVAIDSQPQPRNVAGHPVPGKQQDGRALAR